MGRPSRSATSRRRCRLSIRRRRPPCPVARSLDLVGDWWTLLIVRNALSGTLRFGDFQKGLGVSKSMLAERLQKMVHDGLLEIRPDPEGSAYSEYHLTEKGGRLRMVLMALRQWGEGNLFEPGEAMNVLTEARALAAELRGLWNVEFDDAQAIGKRYRRQDEIGTPYCITVDFETLEDDAVTIRDRDTMAQERIPLDQVTSWLAARLPGC